MGCVEQEVLVVCSVLSFGEGQMRFLVVYYVGFDDKCQGCEVKLKVGGLVIILVSCVMDL